MPSAVATPSFPPYVFPRPSYYFDTLYGRGHFLILRGKRKKRQQQARLSYLFSESMVFFQWCYITIHPVHDINDSSELPFYAARLFQFPNAAFISQKPDPPRILGLS